MDAVALAQRFLGAFAAKDVAAARACLAPDVAWIVPGRTRISGRYQGPDEVLAYFGKLRELTGGTWKATPIDLLAGKTGVVLLSRGEGEREGRRYDATYCLHLRIDDGLIREARLYNADAEAFESFWR